MTTLPRLNVRIHPTAEVADSVAIGPGTRIWNQCQVREGVRIGSGCILGKGAYIDFDVRIGDNVKIQNNVSVFHGATVESGVFLGPGAILTNDKRPRAINPDGSLKSDSDWTVEPIYIAYGASIGAGAIILPGVRIGRFAMVGAGAVVSHNVPDHGLALGNPARLVGWVCQCGDRLMDYGKGRSICVRCAKPYDLDCEVLV